MENKSIFRESALKKISHPNELNKYVKTISPQILIILIAIFLFIVGLLTWALIGKIEISSKVGFLAYEKEAQTYVPKDEYDKYLKDKTPFEISKNSYLTYGDIKLKITSFVGPSIADEDSNSFLLTAANLKIGDSFYYFTGTSESVLETGTFNGKIVYSITSPINFIK